MKALWFSIVWTLIVGALPGLLIGALPAVGLYFRARWRFPNNPYIRRRQWPSDWASKTVVLVGKPPKQAPAAGSPAEEAPPAAKPVLA